MPIIRTFTGEEKVRGTVHDIQLAQTNKIILISEEDKLPAIDPAMRRWMCPDIPICLLSSCKGRKQRSTVPPIKNVQEFHCSKMSL